MEILGSCTHCSEQLLVPAKDEKEAERFIDMFVGGRCRECGQPWKATYVEEEPVI